MHLRKSLVIASLLIFPALTCAQNEPGKKGAVDKDQKKPKVAIEMRLLSVSEELFECRKISLLPELQSYRKNPLLPEQERILRNTNLLTDIQVKTLLEAVGGDSHTQTLYAAKTTVVDGKTARLGEVNQRDVQTGVKMTQIGGQTQYVLDHTTVPLDFTMDVAPMISADRSTVKLRLTATLTTIDPNVPLVWTPVPKIANNSKDPKVVMIPIQPKFTAHEIETTKDVPVDGTIVLSAGKMTRAFRNDVSTPILGNLPLVGRAFRNVTYHREIDYLMLLVTVHIVEDEDEPQAATAR